MINQLIASIISCERKLETIRLQYNQHHLFSIKPILQRFDQQNKGYITPYDIISICQDYDLECSFLDAFYSLKYFDINKDGNATVDDLAIQLLSKTDHEIRFMAAMREPYIMEQQMCLPQFIETGVQEFVKQLLTSVREQLQIKAKLDLQKFNYFLLLQKIDVKNFGSILFQDFRSYFSLNEEDTDYFFMSGNYNQQIDYIDFLDMLGNGNVNYFDTDIQSSTINLEPSKLGNGNHKQTSPEERKTVKINKLLKEQLGGSGETLSNASSIFVDHIATQLQDFSLTPTKDFRTNQFGEFQINTNKQNYQVFLKLLLLCKKVQKVQEKLVQRFDFNCKQLYSIFDNNKKGFIDEQDCSSGFRRLRIEIRGHIKDLVINYGENGLINYELFCLMILPHQFIDTKKEGESKVFSNVTLDYIRQLFQDLIEMGKYKRAEVLKLSDNITRIEKSVLENEIQIMFNKYSTYPSSFELSLLSKCICFHN